MVPVPPYLKHSVLITLLLCGLRLGAQTPFDEFYPYFEAFVPAVYAHSELPEDPASPDPIATVIGADQQPIGSRLAADGTPLSASPQGLERWSSARNRGSATIGAIWAAPAASFHFAIDTKLIELPKPRFTLSRIDAEKFVLVSRSITKKVVRIQLEISPSGKITAIDAGDKTLNKLVKELLDENEPADGNHFEPARYRSDGSPYRIKGEMRWDLSTRPKGGIVWQTDTLSWDNLKGPKEEIPLYVKADGHGGVRGAWLADQRYREHRALPEVLLTALTLPMPNAEPGIVERWTLRVSPILNTIRLFRREKIDHRDPIMLIAPRPEYPRKLWRRGAEGFVYVRFLINQQGQTQEIEIIESSEKAFEEAALEALHLWEFEPALFDGRTIASEVIMTLPFRLPPRT